MRIAHCYIRSGEAWCIQTPYGKLMMDGPGYVLTELGLTKIPYASRRGGMHIEDLVDLACGIERSEN